jgi:hypothetical protein
LAVWLGTFKLDCHKCSDELKVERGCEKDSPIPGAWKLYDWEFQRCPLKIITRQSAAYLRAYNFFNKGYLPNTGGWMEQPVKFIEAMEIIEREVIKIQESELNKK